MGGGAQWRTAGRPSVSAQRRERRHILSQREKCRAFDLQQTGSRLCLAAGSFLLLLAVCFLYLPEPQTRQPRSSEDASGQVTLLVWTHPFGQRRRPPDCWTRYQIAGCKVTHNRSAYFQADAVLIHHREVAVKANVNTTLLPPEPRPPYQKWIWMNYESPTHTRGLSRFRGVFNLTLSYRADSDIFLPYGYLVPRSLPNPNPPNVSPGSRRSRPGLLAWVISNWAESQARVAFYHRLSRYVPVDVFGRAGRPLPDDGGKGSVVRLLRRYHFYLALENSQHTDYITEKLWNAVRAGAVPVVMGPSRDDYQRFLPPQAFIHVDDFPSVQALVRYLLLLRQNPARMRRHLDWRGSYAVYQPEFWAEHYCTACEAVRRARGRIQVVRDIEAWFQS